jgi:uncharacterized protein (TIGR01777 family)
MLKENGYEVSLLSRSPLPDKPFTTYLWDPLKGEIDPRALDRIDFIIHLAGLNIGQKRWTSRRKQLILDSRVKTAELLFNTIRSQNAEIEGYITSSGIGYYGAVTSETLFDENAEAARDFLGQTCQKWESVADRFEEIGIRSVKVRTGVVLARDGGALSKLSLLVKLGAGAPLGSGKQFMPWIHMNDLCGIYLHCLERKEMTGAYNAVAPEHCSNRELTRKIARQLKMPLWLPRVPGGLIRLLFGEMSVMLLEGSRISSDKIGDAGYSFQFPNLEPALKDLLGSGK